MSSLYLLIPLGLVFLGVALWIFLWAVRSGQFEDMEGPAHRILMDDDDPRIPSEKAKTGPDASPNSKPSSNSGSNQDA